MNALSPTVGQRALAQDIADGTARAGAGISTVPASVYTCPERFAEEQTHIFAHRPHVIAPYAQVVAAIQMQAR
jgi:glycine betaine catabolism A